MKNYSLHHLLFLVICSLSSTILIGQTVDLTNYEAMLIDDLPPNTSLTWHTEANPTDANRVTNPTIANCGVTYYSAFYNNLNDSYSDNTTMVPTICNSCPEVNLDLTTAFMVANLPPETILTWHGALPANGSYIPSDPTGIAASGIYHAAIYDPINDCYSSNSTPVIVSINTCCCNR